MLFLLGGQDLEMKTIGELLKEKSVKYIDKKLPWGAKLSSYKEYLDYKGKIYGVELEEDIKPPKNYIAIDHHNNRYSLKSSLEQVADILGVELNRERMLIAKNDSSYIDGMLSINATKDEINRIREMDRKAQGITKEDEKKALISVKNSKNNIIYSKRAKFTAISDLIYDKFDNYVIYNNLTICFYRYYLKDMIKFLKKRVPYGSYYYGGGDRGFICIKSGVLTKDKILELIEEFSIWHIKKEI